MLALIMAGGAGLRLNLGEKPLVSILGKPMIEYVIAAFQDCGCNTVIATSWQTLYTENWARALGYDCIRTSGTDYIRDLHDAVDTLGVDEPFFTCVSDIPCLLPDHIRSIEASYVDSGSEALSVWVPVSCRIEGGKNNYTRSINGTCACPAGINILRGDLIARPQKEYELLIRDRDLAFNVNTREDLQQVRAYLSDRGISRSVSCR
ncbi:MAG TPA: NTP transferase domain-containing protein [Methanoregulaceae archaeon]|nr:NTP transferase domain-containing protein [Methanoregulaceae archaeon]